jgi:hypothetical protein
MIIFVCFPAFYFNSFLPDLYSFFLYSKTYNINNEFRFLFLKNPSLVCQNLRRGEREHGHAHSLEHSDRKAVRFGKTSVQIFYHV